MKSKQLAGALLLTTALVTFGSAFPHQANADSSYRLVLPTEIPLSRQPIGIAGLATDSVSLDGNGYWRKHSPGHGPGLNYPPQELDAGYGEEPQTGPGGFETEELNASNAAVESGAQAAYALGADGATSRVGVIDEDFDLDHPELAPNLAEFIDLTGGNRLRQAGLEDEDDRASLDALEARLEDFLPIGHGTNVAGVIAAARDGNGIHGVAPEAELVAIRADEFFLEDPIEDADGLTETVDDLGFSTFIISPADSDNADDARIVSFSEEDDEANDRLFAELEEAVADENLEVLAAGTGFDDPVLAEAFDAARAAGADIINASLGGDEEAGDDLKDAVVRATDEGRIVVFSNGNTDRVDEDGEPVEAALDAEGFQRSLVNDPRTNGLALVVSMVDENNEAIINNCGTAKDNCLVALGIDVQTTVNGGGIGGVDGSSFAAPTVAGGLALIQDLFPTLTPEELVALVKRTATDLGEEGVDEVFGNGALNVERAVQPVGVASLPTTSSIRGEVVRLSNSTVGLGGAFGDSLSQVASLRQSFFLDEFRRPFKADLSRQVVAADRGINLEGALGASDIETETFVSRDGYQVTLAFKDDGLGNVFGTPVAAIGAAQEAFEQENRLQTLRLSGEVTPGLEITSGFNLTAGQQLTAGPASKATEGLFLFEADAVNPQHSFLGKGNGLSLTQDLSEATSLTIGFLTAGEQIGDRNGEGTTVQADLNHRFANGAALGFAASFTQESEGFLGSEASGAFADSTKTESQFYTLSGSLPLIADIDAFGSATVGLSDLSGVNGGLLSDLERTTSSAFALGLVKKGVIDDKDRLGLRFSQPLRIEGSADAKLLVPTSVNADGSIVTTSDTVSLQPTGRELNLQLAYTRKLADTLNVTNYALARSEPGHNAEAKPDFGIGVRMNWNF
ncbi:MAG: S8 family serine peptidase [Geminicoccaceae bacterium]